MQTKIEALQSENAALKQANEHRSFVTLGATRCHRRRSQLQEPSELEHEHRAPVVESNTVEQGP